MTAKFPNVPNVPGVPALARPDALLATIRIGSNDAQKNSAAAVVSLGQNAISDATDFLEKAKTSADTALAPARQLYSDGTDVVGGLSGVSGNATNAINSLLSGDFNGAAQSADQALRSATRAVSAISRIVSPQSVRQIQTNEPIYVFEESSWGIYPSSDLNAAPIPVDTISAFEIVLDARISDYPVEQGGFASYNKVQTPFEVRVLITRGGTVEQRQETLAAIQAAWQSTDLFDVVTPECVYLDVNVVGVRQQRAADRGNGLMALEVVLRKVRQTATLAFTDTKEPTGEDAVNQGSVQATATPAATANAGAAK